MGCGGSLPDSLPTTRPSMGFSCYLYSPDSAGTHPPCAQPRLHHRRIRTRCDTTYPFLLHQRRAAIDPNRTSPAPRLPGRSSSQPAHREQGLFPVFWHEDSTGLLQHLTFDAGLHPNQLIENEVLFLYFSTKVSHIIPHEVVSAHGLSSVLPRLMCSLWA